MAAGEGEVSDSSVDVVSVSQSVVDALDYRDRDMVEIAQAVLAPTVGYLPYGVHYVVYSPGSSEIDLVYSRELVFDNGRFSGEGCTSLQLSFDPVSKDFNDYGLTILRDGSFSLQPGSVLVFSDLGDYPKIIDRREGDYQHVETIIAAAAMLLLCYRALVGAFFGRRSFGG